MKTIKKAKKLKNMSNLKQNINQYGINEFLEIETDVLTYANQINLTDTSHNLVITIEKNIEGRCCHHKVIALKFIRDFFKNKIKNYLEIGVHNGTSMSYVLNSNYPIFVVGVDLFEDTYGYYQESDRINLKRTQSNVARNNPYNLHSARQAYYMN